MRWSNSGTHHDKELLRVRKKGEDFTNTDPWRVLRLQGEFVEGFEALSKLGPAVTIFGSARTKKDSPYYKAAVEAFTTENWGTAAKLYEDYAASLSDAKKALMGHCMYRAAFCYQKAGMFKEATNAYARFVNEFKEHRLYPDALLRRAECYLGRGDANEARKTILYLKQQVDKKGLGDQWKYEVEFWITYLKERTDSSRALKDYKEIYKKVEKNFPDVANKCRWRIGRVLMMEKKYNEAISYCTEIIEDRLAADREVAAGSYLTRGRSIMSKRDPKPVEADYKAALYDLLRVIVHYKDIGAPQAEAMYYAGKCFQLLGGKDSAKYWQGLYRRLQREWVNTRWAQEAAKELTD